MRTILALTVSLAIGSAALAQNLLINPSFNDPPSPGAPACNSNTTPNASFPGWDDSSGQVKRNDSFGGPTCLDGARMGYSGQQFSRHTYQTVTGLPSGAADYVFTGMWASTVISNTATFSAEVRSGTDPNANLLNQVSRTLGPNIVENWTSFAVPVTKPAGVTTLTVVLRTVANNGFGVAFHAEDASLAQTSCLPIPSITSVDPVFGTRGPTPVTITVTGTGFISGNTTVKLVRDSEPTITGTGTIVSGGSIVSANFDLSNAVLGPWNIQVDVTANSCPSVSASNAFTVISQTFTNGSFELPDPGTSGCPVTPVAGVPTNWLAQEFGEWGFSNRLNRDGWINNGTLTTLPTCPPPDGDHYATIAALTSTAGANARSYQTFNVNPGSKYTLSGYFAGSGNNTARIRLLDGGLTATELGAADIHVGAGAYDWSFVFATGLPTTNVMTAMMTIQRTGGTPNALHADALTVEECVGTSPSVGSATPNKGVNSGVVNLTIDGSGFAGTPTVLLSRSGMTVAGTGVNLVNANQLTANFDLTGLPSGLYDVIVKQGGCVGRAEDVFVVAALDFINGSFEDPDAPVNHGACIGGNAPQPVGGLPTGWNTNAPAGLIRDGNAPLPPNAASACVASSDGGHYGTMSASGTLRAWQTISVFSSATYRFSGEFAGTGDFVIKLVDGADPAATPIAETPVFAAASPSGTWVEASVEATAVSEVMTVVWEIQNAAPGGHADGLAFVNVAGGCNPVRADADGDGDVDSTDFAAFQRCHTGPGAFTLSAECACFNSDGGEAGAQDIDQADFTNLFLPCATRPGVEQTNTLCDGFAP